MAIKLVMRQNTYVGRDSVSRFGVEVNWRRSPTFFSVTIVDVAISADKQTTTKELEKMKA